MSVYSKVHGCQCACIVCVTACVIMAMVMELQADWSLPYPPSINYPHYPYPETDYREQYRGQFHFSSKAGWMNDINGPIYVDGTYHMFYQHYPYGLQWNTMHWGHATSPDLVHWAQQAIKIDPHVHPGDCWSGSAVLDVNNTAGFKTGTNDVICALYTATDSGTCLVYSNDNAETFQNYSGNPLKQDGRETRDPKVFRHTPTQKWVYAIYHRDGQPHGVEFYSSTNLKNWTYESKWYADGFYECPDMYELAIDDDPGNRKWVLQDAEGEYWIGDFDGRQFTTTWGPYKMDQSPKFYAAQVYSNMPDNRIVQMAWIREYNWQGLPIESDTIWRCEASFPCELKLKTFSEGVRITRSPIAEIRNLYEWTQSWDNVSITSNASSNPLSAIQSQEYEIIAEFDLNGASATEFGLKLHTRSDGQAQHTITYNKNNLTLNGYSMAPINNRVAIHVLVDWGQLEIFGNGGKYSFTDSVGWNNNENGMAVWADGNITLAFLQFNELGRCWDPWSSIEKPTQLIATSVNGHIRLSWQDNSHDPQEDGFIIERKPWRGSDTWHQVGSVDSNITQYIDTESLYGQTIYTYRVGAVKQ